MLLPAEGRPRRPNDDFDGERPGSRVCVLLRLRRSPPGSAASTRAPRVRQPPHPQHAQASGRRRENTHESRMRLGQPRGRETVSRGRSSPHRSPPGPRGPTSRRAFRVRAWAHQDPRCCFHPRSRAAAFEHSFDRLFGTSRHALPRPRLRPLRCGLVWYRMVIERRNGEAWRRVDGAADSSRSRWSPHHR